ncbi:hypothetical protein [Actinokineospora cianjurensis]|uniref:Uncharacterized protein n=1 Tax=Actinokineospora cianjurensis TaxID=585224 RepID=A0A421AWW1_9PSEU|nr:hypothetical protein [Actinokineospora cianjurensis]RLK54312.1 hypothetical protein CLV68_5862 [Actinokineospora cianjurensis]
MTILDSLRAHTRTVATALGRSPDREALSPRCPQCGRDGTTAVYRLGRRSARFWCARCEAVVSTRDLAALREVPAPVSLVLPADPHAGYLAPPVLAWARTAAAKALAATELDRATYYQLHTRFDRTAEGSVHSGLPTVSAAIGRLHERCYRVDLVVDDLTLTGPAARERVDHARRWLAGPGRTQCWIVSRHVEDRPEAEFIELAAKAYLRGEPLERDQATALRTGLFGTDGGPRPIALLELFTPDEITAAVRAYRTGTQPLREAVLAALDG